MADTYTFRPKKKVGDLLKTAKKLNYPNLNKFINDAVEEKILREESAHYGGPAKILSEKISKVVLDHMGAKFSIPDAKTAREIDRRVKHMRESKNFIRDEDVRPHRYKKSQ